MRVQPKFSSHMSGVFFACEGCSSPVYQSPPVGNDFERGMMILRAEWLSESEGCLGGAGVELKLGFLACTAGHSVYQPVIVIAA